MIFHGHTDYEADPAAVPEDLSPVSFSQTRVLEDHYKTCGFFYQKLTNTEIEFRLGRKSTALHQGESSRLGSYVVELLVARAIEYSQCCDCAMCAISFMITM